MLLAILWRRSYILTDGKPACLRAVFQLQNTVQLGVLADFRGVPKALGFFCRKSE